MYQYVLALGSSQANGEKYIEWALAALKAHPRISLISFSRIYKNPSAGCHTNRLFFNGAAAVTCGLHPLAFHLELKALEMRLGRIRTTKNASRTMDIDILLCRSFFI